VLAFGAVALTRPELVGALVVVEPNLDPATPEAGAIGSRGIAAYGRRLRYRVAISRRCGAELRAPADRDGVRSSCSISSGSPNGRVRTPRSSPGARATRTGPAF
jgi:hypothetical protein